MARKRTLDEQIQDLETQKEKLKQQMKAKENALRLKQNALKSRQSQAERKARTKRLIEIGATVEHYLKRPMKDGDLEKFSNFLKQQEDRGEFFTKAMNQD